MAKVKMNPIIEQVRGKIGDLVFKRYGEGVVLSPRPDMSGVQPTPAQLAQREEFRQAALFGKMVMADAETKTLYEEAAKAKGQPVFSLIVADFFHAPAVDEIDLSDYGGKPGDPIVVHAHDDFDVTGVTVAITDSAGALLEQGTAAETPPDSGAWTYTATASVAAGTSVRVAVTATDRPGHATTKEETKQ